MRCAYCGVDILGESVDVWRVRDRRVGRRVERRLEPWGPMHAGSCSVWAQRNPAYGGYITGAVTI